MSIYPLPPSHERLNVFFGELFQEMRNAPPETHGTILAQIEEEFRRTGYREEIPAGVENILIVRLNGIGDIVLISGFLREVRRNFPNARITLVVLPMIYPMVEFCPYVNEVLTFERKSVYGIGFTSMLEKIAVFCRDNLWQKHFSIAFSPRWYKDSLLALLILWLSGARERIGYGTYPFHSWLGAPAADVAAQDNFLLTQNIVTPKSVVSEAEKHFYLLEAVGLKVEQTNMELFFDARDFLNAKKLLENLPPSCKKIIIGIGSSSNVKKYPVEKLVVALKELAKKDLAFVITGGKAELDAAAYLEQNLPQGKVLNLVGKTTLRETEAIVAQMDYYIGNDTGVMHMAAVMNIPVLAIYREAQDREDILPGILSDYRRFPPWQTNSVILRPDHPLDDCATLPPVVGHCYHKEAHCITQISPQEIIDGFEALERLV